MDQCRVTDELANEVLETWKEAFPDSALLPVIGVPSTSGGVGVLTYTMGDGNLMRIDNLISKSPLANNALYSFECTKGKFINLYEIMIDDLPGKDGGPSTGQIYINALHAYGLDVAGVHYHWTGSKSLINSKMVLAIHHQKIGLDPVEFSKKTIGALMTVMPVLMERGIPFPPSTDEEEGEPLTDEEAIETAEIWKRAFPNAEVLPVIGYPSNNQGVMTLTHTLGMKLLKINGLKSRSPLTNNALFSSEKTEGVFLNLYEVLVPDVPGCHGSASTAQVYIDALSKQGLDVASSHFHWLGESIFKQDAGVVAVHHYNIGLTPQQFSELTIQALEILECEIRKRLSHV